MPEEYLVIAELDDKNHGEVNAHSDTYPVLVALGTKSGRILIQQGTGHGSNGAVISLSRFNKDKWQEQFEIWGCSWFSELIETLKLDTAKLVDEAKKTLSEVDANNVKLISR